MDWLTETVLDSLTIALEPISDRLKEEGADTGEADLVPPYPTPEAQSVAGKVVKLDDAIRIIHLQFAYSLQQSFAPALKDRIDTLTATLESFGASKLAKALGRKLLGSLVSIAIMLFNLRKKVEFQKSIARKIRFHGRAARFDLWDSVLGFGKKLNPRIVGPVLTRHWTERPEPKPSPIGRTKPKPKPAKKISLGTIKRKAEQAAQSKAKRTVVKWWKKKEKLDD